MRPRTPPPASPAMVVSHPPLRALGALVAVAALLPAPAAAQATAVPAASDTAGRQPTFGGAHFAVHGYVTQAAGVSRGGQTSGISAGGTADVRRAALLARFAPTLADRFVAQVAHRRVGASPAAAYHRAVKLDWLFYERALGDAARVRVGRLPIPWGIYNETRYVGTLLPFYQAPASTYREKEFSTEALDGALVTREFAAASAFPVEASAYAGEIRYLESSQLPVAPELPPGVTLADAAAAAAASGMPLPAGRWTYATARARGRGVGGNVWVTTPVPGLRVGGGGLRARLKGGLRPNGGLADATVWFGSVDGSFDRVTARAEAMHADLGAVRVRGGYVQLGARVARAVTVNAQTDYSHFRVTFLPLPPTYTVRPFSFTQNRDHAASVVWSATRRVQVRVEGHLTRGYNAEEALDLTGAPRRGRHAILSLSSAF